MRWFARFAFVALLAFSASGLADLAVPEPCQLGESTTQEDSTCPATCVRCTCCAQSIEVFTIGLASAPIRQVADAVPARPLALPGNPSEVLHVPRPVTL